LPIVAVEPREVPIDPAAGAIALGVGAVFLADVRKVDVAQGVAGINIDE
jgi:hypothetical protein